MSRLQAQMRRLYGADEHGVRGLVLTLRGSMGWPALAPLWRGVQADLDLPAPGISVSGTDGLQLWFSLGAPVSTEAGLAWLARLRAHYLADVPADRVQTFAVTGSHRPWPPAEVQPQRWSAFIAADLAPLFSDEPWLDHPPGADAQADLLSRLACAEPGALAPAQAPLAALATPTAPQPAEPAPGSAGPQTPAGGRSDDPSAFLRSVMNDPAVPLALRIEAAKALLAG